jgi:putative ABC transport system ATP-binding protein
MGLVFQFFNLLPSLTVLENIELPMALAGVKKSQRHERAHELLRYFDLTQLAERFQDNLSGGEKQRIAIIRALVNYPAMLLADEPTSSIDDENSALLLDLLYKICKEQKVAVILTSTDLYEKLPVSKDYVLKDGQLKPAL